MISCSNLYKVLCVAHVKKATIELILQDTLFAKGVFRRHDLVVLTKSYMILSCMIFLFRWHYNVMCDFFQQ